MNKKTQTSSNEKPVSTFSPGATLYVNEKTKGTEKETVPTSRIWHVTGVRTLKAVQ